MAAIHYKGKFHAEQDTGWEGEWGGDGKWAATKPVSLKTWTIYETVGKPSYETGRFFLKNERAALNKLKTLMLDKP